MELLTKRIGRFPLGVWVVLVLLLTSGLFVTLFGQALSILSWDTALSLGLQDDSPHSDDIVERMMMAISWGEAGADVLVQGTLIILTVVGIFLRRRFGYVAGVGLAIIWIYVTFLITLESIALHTWGLVPDLSRAQHVGPLIGVLVGIPGVVSLVCLMANRAFFEENRGRSVPGGMGG